MEQPSCGSCQFCFKKRNSTELMCRRYPPQAEAIITPAQQIRGMNVAPNIGAISLFPPVMSDYWCGEYVKSTPESNPYHAEWLERRDASA